MLADVPPAVIQIAKRAQSQETGILLYRLRRTFDVHAGPFARHDELELVEIVQDGVPVKVRVIRDLIGGKSAGADVFAKTTAQYEHPQPGDVFERPFDPKYAGDYTFAVVDPHTFRFSSSMHDSSHGSGTFTTNAAGDVVQFVYVPNVLPKYASSGTITDDRTQVLPDTWFAAHEVQNYRGRYGLFAGAATTLNQYDDFKRFQDVPAAIAAMNAFAGAP